MTADQFRELALSLPGAAEASHMGHPDFRFIRLKRIVLGGSP